LTEHYSFRALALYQAAREASPEVLANMEIVAQTFSRDAPRLSVDCY